MKLSTVFGSLVLFSAFSTSAFADASRYYCVANIIVSTGIITTPMPSPDPSHPPLEGRPFALFVPVEVTGPFGQDKLTVLKSLDRAIVDKLEKEYMDKEVLETKKFCKEEVFTEES